MNKIQNCPLCGSKARLWEDRHDDPEPNLAWCLDEFKKDCAFKQGDFCIDIETWNKIRIAPDGEEFNLSELELKHKAVLDLSGQDFIAVEDWMKPNYPKEE